MRGAGAGSGCEAGEHLVERSQQFGEGGGAGVFLGVAEAIPGFLEEGLSGGNGVREGAGFLGEEDEALEVGVGALEDDLAEAMALGCGAAVQKVEDREGEFALAKVAAEDLPAWASSPARSRQSS